MLPYQLWLVPHLHVITAASLLVVTAHDMDKDLNASVIYPITFIMETRFCKAQLLVICIICVSILTV